MRRVGSCPGTTAPNNRSRRRLPHSSPRATQKQALAAISAALWVNKPEFPNLVGGNELRQIKNRRAGRFQFIASINVVNLESEKEINGRTGDLNMFGCYVTTSMPFPHGTRVIVRINHGARSFKGAGRVSFTRANLGMGIAFTVCELGKQTILDEWLAHLKMNAVCS